VGEEYWCMQWSGEVLPEPAMVPDLGVFLYSVSAYSQVVTAGGHGRLPVSHSNDVREALLAQAREKFPGRLKLPFILSPSGENKALTADQPEALIITRTDGS
jgi:hypothetical protein